MPGATIHTVTRDQVVATVALGVDAGTVRAGERVARPGGGLAGVSFCPGKGRAALQVGPVAADAEGPKPPRPPPHP